MKMKNLVRDEWAQDVVEYTLLLGFLALAAAGVFLGAGGNVQGIWNTADSQLALADGGSGSSSNGSNPSNGSGSGQGSGNQGSGNQGSGNQGGNGHNHGGHHGGDPGGHHWHFGF